MLSIKYASIESHCAYQWKLKMAQFEENEVDGPLQRPVKVRQAKFPFRLRAEHRDRSDPASETIRHLFKNQFAIRARLQLTHTKIRPNLPF